MANNSINRYFEGFLIGGALGFLAGLLAAPKPGIEMRKELAETADDLLTLATESGKELVDNYMGNNSGPLYTAGSKAGPYAAGG